MSLLKSAGKSMTRDVVLWVTLLFVAVTLFATTSQAKEPSTSIKRGPNKPVSAADQAAVMSFVTEHHSELAPLLKRLSQDRPKQYDEAVRDIRKVKQRIERFQKKSPDRAEIELDKWKIDSRVKLVTAQAVTLVVEASQSDSENESPELIEIREQLQDLSRQQVDIEKRRLAWEEAMLTRRLDEVRQQAALLDEDPETVAASKFDKIDQQIITVADKRAKRVGKKKKKKN